MPATRPLSGRGALMAAALIVLVLMLTACDTSSTPSPSAAASAPSAACEPEQLEQGGIDGSVVDAEGNPLNDILVLLDNGAGFTGEARTLEDGVFSAPGISGEFTITTVDIDYAEVVQRVTVPCGELVEVELVLTPVED